MNPFDFLKPYRRLMHAALAVVVVAAIVGGYLAWSAHEREIGRTEVRAEWTAEKLAQAEADAKEGKRRVERQEDSQRERNAKTQAAVAAASRADGVSRELRKQLAALQQRGANPTPSADSAPAGDPIGVLADVLRRADGRAGILAAYADSARIAGQQCERDYDALTGK